MKGKSFLLGNTKLTCIADNGIKVWLKDASGFGFILTKIRAKLLLTPCAR